MEVATKKFVLDDGTKVVLPLIKTKVIRGLFSSYISNVAGVYGGWITDANLSDQQIKEIIKWINKHLKNFTWRINPFDEKLRDFEIPGCKKDFTQYLDLRNGFEPIYKSWTEGHASAVRQAIREGIVIKEAVSLKEWKDYFAIYETSLQRWGDEATSSYPYLLFENIFKESKESSGNIKLWLAYFENSPVSGALNFYNNHHVGGWHAATLEKFFPKRPAHLLQYEIIKDACKKGYWWYDFNPSGGHEGVVKFKKSFGTVNLETNVIINNSVCYKMISMIYSTIRRVIKHEGK
jgi:hypothetical protein